MIIYFLNDCLFDKDISLYKKLPEVGYRLASSVGGKAARLPEGRFRRAKKKSASYLHRTAQPHTLAIFRSWGSSAGAGRIRLAGCKYNKFGQLQVLLGASAEINQKLTPG